MTKDEHIAKLREALQNLCNGLDATPIHIAHWQKHLQQPEEAAKELLSLTSSSEPPQPVEITDEMMERALEAWFAKYKNNYGAYVFPQIGWQEQKQHHKDFMRAALQAALGAKP